MRPSRSASVASTPLPAGSPSRLARFRRCWWGWACPGLYLAMLAMGALTTVNLFTWTSGPFGAVGWLVFTLGSVGLLAAGIRHRTTLRTEESRAFRWSAWAQTVVGVLVLLPWPVPYVNGNGLEVLGMVLGHLLHGA